MMRVQLRLDAQKNQLNTPPSARQAQDLRAGKVRALRVAQAVQVAQAAQAAQVAQAAQEVQVALANQTQALLVIAKKRAPQGTPQLEMEINKESQVDQRKALKIQIKTQIMRGTPALMRKTTGIIREGNLKSLKTIIIIIRKTPQPLEAPLRMRRKGRT